MNRFTPIRESFLIFLVGVCLSLSQFIMIRDFVTILYGEEVVIILVTAAFFSGLSIGYFLSLKFSTKAFEVLFLGIVFLHLTFPFSYRILAVWIAQWELNGSWYIALMFFYALIFSSLYATFLPRLVHHEEEEEASKNLKKFYSVEIAGFGAGFILVGLSWNKGVGFIIPIYWVFLAIIVHLALQKKNTTLAFALLACIASVFLSKVDRRTTALLYENKHSLENATTLLSINSAYQKVEVMKDGEGEHYLYLDGLLNLNASDLEDLNFYIALIPAKLCKPEKALIVGNGTLSSVSKVYPYAKQVQSVELDTGVLLAGQKFFTPKENLSALDRWSLTIDDGKHFLKTTPDKYDLIIMDIPSPLTIQEAILHTVEFYQLVRSKMTEQGVIAVQLSGPLQKNNRTPARVVSALSKVFKQVMVLDSEEADRSFAYASNHLPFNTQDVREATQKHEEDLVILPPKEIAFYITEALPLAIDNLDLVLRRGWERFTNRYFDDD